MKIAVIVNRFPALSETFVLNQITGLLDMGIEVTIYAERKSDESKIHPDVEKYSLLNKVYYFNLPHNKIVRALKALWLFILNFYKEPLKIIRAINIFKYKNLMNFYVLIRFLGKQYDVIYCNYGPNGIIGAFLKEMKIGKKIITAFHGFDLSKLYISQNDNIYKDLFIKGDLFLPISEYWKEKLINMGCNEKKIMVHHMGVDLEKLKFSIRTVENGDIIKILTVGRLVEKKGHKYSIKAIAKIISKYNNIKYTIAGDGPLISELKDLVKELGINEYIDFLGEVRQDEVYNLYQQAHIFMLSSITACDGNQEGIPVVLMEALSTGLPVVSTKYSGIPELVVNDKSGFLVEEKDIDSLAEKIEYLIKHKNEWVNFGRCGREFVEREFNIARLNKKLAGIIHMGFNNQHG